MQAMWDCDLTGPHRLSLETVEWCVSKTSAGVFALGHLDTQGRFRVGYVGRAADRLRDALCRHIGSEPLFKYAYCDTTCQAFERECLLFHRYAPPGNILHPARVPGSGWHCPVCAASTSPARAPTAVHRCKY